MNKYEQYRLSNLPQSNGFRVGDKIVWWYFNGDSPWYGIIEQIEEDGTIYTRGAWAARVAFFEGMGGAGVFPTTRKDGYMRHYYE